MSVRDYEFEQFVLTPQRYELTRAGRPVRLEKIPFDLLALLVEHRHELVSRDAITAALWPNGGFQDVDQSLNTAIRKVRLALQDNADEPRFIQTVVGRGYRFLADVRVNEGSPAAEPPAAPAPPAVPAPPALPKKNRLSPFRRLALLAAFVPLLAAGWLALHTPRDPTLIAVLPFDDLNGAPSQAYFSRGLTEEVITQLGRVAPAGFGVIAGPSVWRYRGSQLAPPRIASELGAGYIVTGAVEHDASHVRISARLIRARDGLQLWADTFDRPGDAALALQSEVAASVAGAMGIRLAPGSAARHQRIEGEAADLYLRGRFYWNQRTEVSLKQAIEYFDQSIARAPGYAPAYAALADCYAAMVYSCYLAPSMGFERARAALEHASQLDASAPEVLASEGYLNMYFDWDLAKATRNLERAVAGDPNYATAYDWLGVLFTASRRFSAAQSAFERARRLDPASLPIRTDLAFHLHYSGRNEDARLELQNILKMDANFPLAHFWMGRVLSSESNCSGALSELETASSSSLRDWQPVIAAHGHIAGVCGQPSRAQEDLRRFDEIAHNRFVTSYGYALIYAGLGEKEQALVWLRKAVEERSHWLVWIRVDPRFDTLRGDPRFQQLVTSVFPGD